MDSVALRLGAAALSDQAWMKANVEKVKRSRAELVAALGRMGFRLWPTQANFLMARPPQGDAGRLYRELRERGILVRYWDRPGLADKLRITVGTDDENRMLLDALRQLVI